MALKGLAVVTVEINDEVIEIKPNSLSFKGGLGDINVRHQTGGGEAGTKVITEDAETQIGMVKFSLITETTHVARVNTWGLLSRNAQGNVVRLSGEGFTRNFRQMRLITDPEVAIGADADFEVVFEGNAATFMNELTFPLTNRLSFANLETGADDETMEITLRAPDWNCRKQMFRVKGHVERAFVSIASKLSDLAAQSDTKKPDDDGRMEGALVMTMLGAGSGDNLDKVFDDFVQLALKVGQINEKTPLKEVHFERMGVDDATRLCGEYIGFFVMPSVLSMTKSDGSDR